MADVVVRGHRVPALCYGTAWKEDRTEALTLLALEAGFRAIDTANQRKHYVEAGVGAAIARAGIPRDQLFLQTKFTHREGQDHRLPYDPRAPIATQVEQSFASSLEHLGTTYLDSYVMHGPSTNVGLAPQDVEAWRAMETLHDRGVVRLLGVSNVSLEQLHRLTGLARVQPAFVQNRCYASRGWDADVRAFCRAHDITYQGFSLLTANRRELVRPAIDEIMMRTGMTREQVVFRFALSAGMMPLTGTSNREHMAEDLAAAHLVLDDKDLRTVETIGTSR
ncbi:MAG TPA: aldo/keto reductase [Kofleriaceae bacterium]|nr:aldo/keto reductase [Kofleriaceae bacterium]